MFFASPLSKSAFQVSTAKKEVDGVVGAAEESSAVVCVEITQHYYDLFLRGLIGFQ